MVSVLVSALGLASSEPVEIELLLVKVIRRKDDTSKFYPIIEAGRPHP